MDGVFFGRYLRSTYIIHHESPDRRGRDILTTDMVRYRSLLSLPYKPSGEGVVFHPKT